jgi:hypothetical protein
MVNQPGPSQKRMRGPAFNPPVAGSGDDAGRIVRETSLRFRVTRASGERLLEICQPSRTESCTSFEAV